MPQKKKSAEPWARYPVVNLGAEYLVMGHLMRRNILTYKAPPNYEGYDLIAVHPNPRVPGPKLRLQVKSRLATDAGYFFPLKERALDSFDFLVFVRLNVDYFYGRAGQAGGGRAPEFYTLSPKVVEQHFSKSGGWGGRIVFHKGDDLTPYRDERGFEQIARALRVPLPAPPDSRIAARQKHT